MKKRIFAVAVTLILFAFLFAGCKGGSGGPDGGGSGSSGGGDTGGGPGSGAGGEQGAGAGADTLTGATADILASLLEETKKTLDRDKLPETFVDPTTAENSPGMLGLSPDDFVSFVSEATSATGMLMTHAFQVSVVKCGDAHDAEMIEGMIRSGYDSGKWICVYPEQSLTMVSGSYILLAVGWKDTTDVLAENFKKAADGNVKGPNIFYSGEVGGDGGGGGGGLALPMPVDTGNAG